MNQTRYPAPAASPLSLKKPPDATTRWDLGWMYLRSKVVEGKGFEPSTSALRTPRSPN